MKHDETVDYWLKVVWQTISNRYNQLAAEYGLTQTLGYLLINVKDEGSAVTELATLLGVKSTSLSRTLNKMEQMNLIFRQNSMEDKRSVKIFLTEHGKLKRKEAKLVVRAFNDYLFHNINLEETEQLKKILEQIINLTSTYNPSKL